MIFLFESTATEFDNGGLGSLSDISSGIVEEERNGMFELTMQYPIDGRHFKDLQLRRLILAKPNPFDDPEPFRIYAISKPLNGIVTVNAEHISYDMSGYAVKPFTAGTVESALVNLKQNSVVTCPFTFWTDKRVTAQFAVDKPSSMRALLGGVEGSILDVYGKGEYKFEKFLVRLYTNRGNNNGVTIRYGKNLTDINQEENCSNVYTAVYPYWYSDEDGLVTLPDFIVEAPGTYDFNRILPLDLSGKFETAPQPEDLEAAAVKYINDNNIGVPKVNLEVSFVELSKSKEYEHYQLLEAVRLCDTVNVEFPKLGVSATSKCVKTTYDIIADRYVSIELGESSTTLADTISVQSQEIKKNPADNNQLRTAVNNATKLITGGLGGYVILRSSSSGSKPDEILITNNENIYASTTKLWRWNKNGLGYSSNGYNGQFALAMTADGHIVADFVNTGSLDASIITAGRLMDQTNTNYWDLESGEFSLTPNTLIGGTKISEYVDSKNLLRGTAKPVLNTHVKGTSLTINDDVITCLNNLKWIVDYLDYKDYKDCEYTISFDAMLDGSAESWNYMKLQVGFVPASRINTLDWQINYERYAEIQFEDIIEWTTWQRYSYTFKVPDDLTKGNTNTLIAGSMLSFYIYAGGVPIKIKHIQLEKGSIATSWSPALADEIDSRATSVAETVANNAIDAYDDLLTQQEIYNRLTNNSQNEGIWLTGGHLYLNASMINTGFLSANYIQGGSLTSLNNFMSIDLNSGDITYANGGVITMTSDTDIFYIRESRLEGYYKKNESTTEVLDGILDLSAQTQQTSGSTTTVVRDVALTAITHDLRLMSSGGGIYLYAGSGAGKKVYSNGDSIVGSRGHKGQSGQSTNENTFIHCLCSGYDNGYFIEVENWSGTTYRAAATTSDRKLKTDIEPSKVKALDVINSIEHYRFRHIISHDFHDCGYIAQQLEKAIPMAIMNVPQYDEKGNMVDEIKQIVDHEILVYVTKAIQELYAEVMQLKEGA